MFGERVRRAYDLRDHVIVVTGAGSGMGQAIALDFAALGARVVAVDAAAAGLEQTSAAAEAGTITSIVMDVRRRAEVEAAVAEVVERFGRVDGLVNCAAVTRRFPAVEFPEEEWDRILDVNLKGTFLCCQAFGRQMVAQRRGKIVNFVSVAGIVGHPNSSAYQASKGGVVQLTRSLAVEWAPHGVNVNAIAPAVVMTPMQKTLRAQDPALFDHLVAKMPVGRAAEPEEISASVLFLVSAASDLVTGHILAVDGGYLAQ